MTITRVNVYRSDGEWCYSAYDDEDGYDHSDTLGVEGEGAAMREAKEQFPLAEIVRERDVRGGQAEDGSTR